MDVFLNKAQELHKENDRAYFLKCDFTREVPKNMHFDYVVSSQAFNNCYSDAPNNMSVILCFMEKMFNRCNKGISFNFVVNRVNKYNPGVAYHDPVEILNHAYSLTNSVVMDNSCMPFECTCTLLKDSSNDGKVLDSFRRKHKSEFDEGIFCVKSV